MCDNNDTALLRIEDVLPYSDPVNMASILNKQFTSVFTKKHTENIADFGSALPIQISNSKLQS